MLALFGLHFLVHVQQKFNVALDLLTMGRELVVGVRALLVELALEGVGAAPLRGFGVGRVLEQGPGDG